MYVRQPDRNRQGMKVPDNYGGNVFRDPNPYSDMPPPARIDHFPAERQENYDISPKESPPPRGEDIFEEKEIYEPLNVPPTTATQKSEEKKPSIFSSLFPSNIASSSHFPFGHGIGTEELLILAMMLLIFLSENENEGVDYELILLLGLLLFAG